jgi:hypothetical protein
VISGGTFNGFIVVNNNDGTVGLIDPSIGTETISPAAGRAAISFPPTPATARYSFRNSKRLLAYLAARVAALAAGQALARGYLNRPPSVC